MSIPFAKMHGLGNDFVVLDATRTAISLTAEQITRMSDRRLGIGFDQLLLIESTDQSSADFRYRIFNADGREVGQCGNGARCVGIYIRQQGLSNKERIILQTQHGEMELKINADDEVSVTLPAPKFAPSQIPFITKQSQPPYSLDLPTGKIELGVVNMGNPHAVIQVAEVESAPMSTIGKAVAKDSHFPEGVNVGFMQVVSRSHIRLRVLERGVGETLACGSGACAAMAYGRYQLGLAKSVTVSLPGGDLQVSWPGGDSPLVMHGTGKMVYIGKWLDA